MNQWKSAEVARTIPSIRSVSEFIEWLLCVSSPLPRSDPKCATFANGSLSSVKLASLPGLQPNVFITPECEYGLIHLLGVEHLEAASRQNDDAVDEMILLLQSAPDHLVVPMAIKAFSGVRTEEMVKLHWEHIDWNSCAR